MIIHKWHLSVHLFMAKNDYRLVAFNLFDKSFEGENEVSPSSPSPPLPVIMRGLGPLVTCGAVSTSHGLGS